MKNELRIGNFVKIHQSKIQMTESDFRFRSNFFKPIQLTEEWLLKFGFEKLDGNYYLNGYYASFDADYPLWIGQQGCCQYETIKENIKYVHQLQNLYFALTNKELTI